MQSKPRQSTESEDFAVLAQPREARPSGAMRVVSEPDVSCPEEDTLRFGHEVTRSNARLPVLPSILVDAYYLQTVSSLRKRTRQRKLALAAASAFVFGALAAPATVNLLRQLAAPVIIVGATDEVRPKAPAAAAPKAELPISAPPQRSIIDRKDAAEYVRDAQALRRVGRTRDARKVLAEVLRDRPGYPPALSAMAELELEGGRAGVAVRWARLAVRALPSSVEHRDLLRRACTAAGRKSSCTSTPAFTPNSTNAP